MTARSADCASKRESPLQPNKDLQCSWCGIVNLITWAADSQPGSSPRFEYQCSPRPADSIAGVCYLEKPKWERSGFSWRLIINLCGAPCANFLKRITHSKYSCLKVMPVGDCLGSIRPFHLTYLSWKSLQKAR